MIKKICRSLFPARVALSSKERESVLFIPRTIRIFHRDSVLLTNQRRAVTLSCGQDSAFTLTRRTSIRSSTIALLMALQTDSKETLRVRVQWTRSVPFPRASWQTSQFFRQVVLPAQREMAADRCITFFL